MSQRTLRQISEQGSKAPLLRPGDRLTQEEYHRRYETYTDGTRFELIAGIVHMMAPAGFEHGSSGFDITTLLGVYKAATPGVLGANGPTVILGKRSEPEPDAVLFVSADYGGQAQIKQVGKKKYIVGAPELVVEVAHSTIILDLHTKREEYRVGGAREYIVVGLENDTVHWFDLAANEELQPDSKGILHSRMFPGLWIETEALLAGDASRLIEAVQKGIASPEHEEFVARLAQQHENSFSSQGRKTTAAPRKRKRGKK
jgi:Uma2 family endonuclease